MSGRHGSVVATRRRPISSCALVGDASSVAIFSVGHYQHAKLPGPSVFTPPAAALQQVRGLEGAATRADAIPCYEPPPRCGMRVRARSELRARECVNMAIFGVEAVVYSTPALRVLLA